MALDNEILIIGAGMSGLGFAVQLIRRFNIRSFEIIEKSDDLGGTWWVNKYPGCGCDVPSHFYSYSFALNPYWTQKYSMRTEIQRYFASVAKQYKVDPHVRLHTVVETADWDESSQTWVVGLYDSATKKREKRRCKVLISAVGGLSVPRECEIPGADQFKNRLFHSARWDQSFDWEGKEVVVLGNGCSATQFVPVMTNGPKAVKRLTQFGRSAHYLAERQNPTYSSAFKTAMRYLPFAMRVYRAYQYWMMERDFSGFHTEGGRHIRDDLAKKNVEYVQEMAPEKYWDALIPKYNIGCKRKVLDTDYLASLHRPNVELVANDPVDSMTDGGVLTKSGRYVHADAIVLATGFQTSRMLFPMEIRGKSGISLNDHWDTESGGAPQAYFGTCVSGFPNFFILMGPNTVTGHLSVIYTVECQINFVLRVLDPLVRALPSYKAQRLLPSIPLLETQVPVSVAVNSTAARNDSMWLQQKLKSYVWSSGCTSWALDSKTGMNIMMYPDEQYMFWLRSVFFRRNDFEYRDDEGSSVRVIGSRARKMIKTVLFVSMIATGAFAFGVRDRKGLNTVVRSVVKEIRGLVGRIR